MDESIRALERRAATGDADARELLQRARARAGIDRTPDEVLDEARAIVGRIDAATLAHRDRGLAAFRVYVEAMFAAEAGVNAAILRGYTPSFLAGERCEHEQTFLLREKGEALLAKNDLRVGVIREHRDALFEFMEVLQLAYGSGWQLTMRRTDDDVEIEHTAYYEWD